MGTVLPIVIAAAAAFAILLIALGLAGGSSVDPVQARLTQLGTMQARNLEEIGSSSHSSTGPSGPL